MLTLDQFEAELIESAAQSYRPYYFNGALWDYAFYCRSCAIEKEKWELAMFGIVLIAVSQVSPSNAIWMAGEIDPDDVFHAYADYYGESSSFERCDCCGVPLDYTIVGDDEKTYWLHEHAERRLNGMPEILDAEDCLNIHQLWWELNESERDRIAQLYIPHTAHPIGYILLNLRRLSGRLQFLGYRLIMANRWWWKIAKILRGDRHNETEQNDRR